jgi:hypothetical protein
MLLHDTHRHRPGSSPVVYLENIENETQQFKPTQDESDDKLRDDDLLEIVFTSAAPVIKKELLLQTGISIQIFVHRLK